MSRAVKITLMGLALGLALIGLDPLPAFAAGMRKYWDVAWSLINFGIVVYILYRLLKEPLIAFFGKKRQEVEKGLADAETQAESAAQELAAMKTKTANVQEELDRITGLLEERGAGDREKIVAEAEARARQIVERAELDAQRRLREATKSLKDEVVEQALGLAQHRLSALITTQDQDRLVKSYLEEISRLAG